MSVDIRVILSRNNLCMWFLDNRVESKWIQKYGEKTEKYKSLIKHVNIKTMVKGHYCCGGIKTLTKRQGLYFIPCGDRLEGNIPVDNDFCIYDDIEGFFAEINQEFIDKAHIVFNFENVFPKPLADHMKLQDDCFINEKFLPEEHLKELEKFGAIGPRVTISRWLVK